MASLPPPAPTEGDIPLFGGYEPPEPPASEMVEQGLSAGQRLTLRQAENIKVGVHPLTRGPLHAEATREAARSDGKDLPYRCGSCYFRDTNRYHNKTFGKCWFPGNRSPEELRKWGYPRVTHGPATDVRSWWPACADYSGGGVHSPDAARSIPGGNA